MRHLIISLLILAQIDLANANQFSHTLRWYIGGIIHHTGDSRRHLVFEEAYTDPETSLPLFGSRYPVVGNYSDYHAELINTVFEECNEAETRAILNKHLLTHEIEFRDVELSFISGEPYVFVSFVPLRINHETYRIEKLIAFTIRIEGKGELLRTALPLQPYNSVLTTGNWYKIRVSETGIHKISYEDLVAAGINAQSINPATLRLFGNGGAMLPEQTDLPRPDDLLEVALHVVTQQPGTFQPGDYFLFFGQSPHQWRPVIAATFRRFEFTKHLYSDHNHYFLTWGGQEGARVQNSSPINDPPTDIVTTFNDKAAYKPDMVNLAKSGREWFADKIYGNQEFNLPSFNFPFLTGEMNVSFRSRFAVRASEASKVRIRVGKAEFESANVPGLSEQQLTYQYARTTTISGSLTFYQNPLPVKVSYPNSNISSAIWIDYVELNVIRSLTYTGNQMLFANLQSVGPGKISEFVIQQGNSQLIVWNVTHHQQPENIQYDIINNEIRFRYPTTSYAQFIIFNHNNVYQAEIIGAVPNQNLHALQPANMVIITPPEFLFYAEFYAKFRRQTEGLSVLVVGTDQIYNEFSSGNQDITAIRDFMRMLYHREQGNSTLKYLLLFGDTSYDPKDRLPQNTNFVPSYQSQESLRHDLSFVTDDYYGLLDNGEGINASGNLDISIGRFPVKNAVEANLLINKIGYYVVDRAEVHGVWRNTLCYIAHDEDRDVHFEQTEEIAQYVDTNYRQYVVDKIYLDAYKRTYVSNGFRYPEVNRDINKRVKEGALFINYIGHGGELGWATSQVLTIQDISSWDNINHMPLFLTATCAFGRFDNPAIVSAGEHVILNPNGGGVGLLTTSRLAYSSFNFMLNKSFMRRVFQRIRGQYPTMGELLRDSKNENFNNSYIKNFVLLGDPSLRLAYPDFNVITTSITDVRTNSPADTIKALMEIEVRGYIADITGAKVTDFNGFIYPYVYDKPQKYMTLANDVYSTPRPFYLQTSPISKGRFSVSNGEFIFRFIVPKDISFVMGKGKIGYYATTGTHDAHGYYNNFIIGGTGNGNVNDQQGPEINLTLNDQSFTPGSFTHSNPVLIARISDPSGINYLGLGIGHEITARLDDDANSLHVLNEYFTPDLDSHTSGTVMYQLKNIPEGIHTLRVKAWDLANNSSESSLLFVVRNSLNLQAGALRIFPNPTTDGAWISLRHNFKGPLKLTIEICDMAGRVQHTIGPVIKTSVDDILEPEYWNGYTANGKLLSRGVYLVRAWIEAEKNQQTFVSGKLILY